MVYLIHPYLRAVLFGYKMKHFLTIRMINYSSSIWLIMFSRWLMDITRYHNSLTVY